MKSSQNLLKQVAHILNDRPDGLRKRPDAIQCSVKCLNSSTDSNHRELIFVEMSGQHSKRDPPRAHVRSSVRTQCDSCKRWSSYTSVRTLGRSRLDAGLEKRRLLLGKLEFFGGMQGLLYIWCIVTQNKQIIEYSRLHSSGRRQINCRTM